jgi:hypothetical protein
VKIPDLYKHTTGGNVSTGVQKITEWSQRIHELALEKGWWQDGIENRSVAEIVANFHGEISEAWEEYRAGRMALWYSAKDGTPYSNAYAEELFATQPEWAYEYIKPEGFWVEIADLLIRIADTMGAYQWQCQDQETEFVISSEHAADTPRFTATLHTAIAVIYDCKENVFQDDAAVTLSETIIVCCAFARQCGVDLWSLIELKHAYNQTRPIRHGGKLA